MGGVAVIGAGYWGRNLVRNFHDLQSLGAVCDASQEVMDGLRSQYPDCRYVFSYRDILQDASIRAVAVATPAETHAALVREALLAGKDVFVEKPLCLSVTEGRDLVALAAERQRVLMVGHLLWYHPAVLKLKELVTNISIPTGLTSERSAAKKTFFGPSPRTIFPSFWACSIKCPMRFPAMAATTSINRSRMPP
jgi:predicted dehydrogenase